MAILVYWTKLNILCGIDRGTYKHYIGQVQLYIVSMDMTTMDKNKHKKIKEKTLRLDFVDFL